MEPVSFPMANDVLRGGRPDVLDLPIYRGEYPDGDPALISCWRMTWRERFAALLRGRVYLHFIARTHPPVYVCTKPPAEQPGAAKGE